MKIVFLLFFLTLSCGASIIVPSYIHGFDKYLQFLHYQENVSFFMKYNVTTEYRKHFHDTYIQCNVQCSNLPGRKRFNSMVQCVQKAFLQVYDNMKIDQSHQPFLQHLNRLEKFESRSYCKYSWIDSDLTTNSLDKKKNEENIFHFQIKQFDCEYERFFPSTEDIFQNLRKGGGSSFSVISKGLLLKTCMVYDRFNGIYDVYCNIELEARKQAEKTATITNVCVNVTVSLDHEFYHAYQEFAYLVRNYAFIFPLHQLLVEDKQYCQEITNNYHSNEQNSLHPFNLQYDGYYSSNYLKNLISSTNTESSQSVSRSHTFQYSFGYWIRRDSIRSSFDSQELDKVDHSIIPLLYKTQNTDYTWEAPLLEEILQTNNSGVDKELFIPSYIPQTDTNEMNYYHVGASHSRYNFDFSLYRYLLLTNASEDFQKSTMTSLHESFERFIYPPQTQASSSSNERSFTQDYYDNLLNTRKSHYSSTGLTNRHSDSHWNNFLSYKEILFMSELVPYLQTFCHTFKLTMNDNSNTSPHSSKPAHHVIAFQFGSWDFTFYPVMLLLQYKEDIMKLIKKIINNSNCMKSLTLIYVTPPPFSDICHDNLDNNIVNNDICHRARGIYRNNYQISVYLHSFINELNELIQLVNHGKKEKFIRFFIIDAFHMNLPRSIYYGESVGMNHLLYYESSGFIATPGGWKLLQLIEHAMTFFNPKQ